MPVVPYRGGDQVLVHRKGQRGGPAGAAEVPNEATSLPVGETAAAKFLGHKRRIQLCRPYVGIVLGDESIRAIVCGSPLSEYRTEFGYDSFPILDRPVIMSAFSRVLRWG